MLVPAPVPTAGNSQQSVQSPIAKCLKLCRPSSLIPPLRTGANLKFFKHMLLFAVLCVSKPVVGHRIQHRITEHAIFIYSIYQCKKHNGTHSQTHTHRDPTHSVPYATAKWTNCTRHSNFFSRASSVVARAAPLSGSRGFVLLEYLHYSRSGDGVRYARYNTASKHSPRECDGNAKPRQWSRPFSLVCTGCHALPNDRMNEGMIYNLIAGLVYIDLQLRHNHHGIRLCVTPSRVSLLVCSLY